MGVMMRPGGVSPARWRFAKLFEKLLSKEESPVRPNLGWSRRLFADAIKKTPPAITYWCSGKAIPETEDTVEVIIRVLFADKPGYEERKSQLRLYWRLARQETNKRWNVYTGQDEVSQAAMTLRRFLLPLQAKGESVAWRVENIIAMISAGHLTSEMTTQVVRAIARIQCPERDDITKALSEILLEAATNEAEERIKEIAASVISKYWAWSPADSAMKALLDMCYANLKRSSTNMTIISPLSVGLARAGCPDILTRTIRRLIIDRYWSERDFNTVERFYGNEYSQLYGVLDHFDDPHRSGLIWANDTNTLLMLADSTTLPGDCKREIKPKLLLCAKLLHEAGLENEAREAEDKANRIK
jgi:hypothetical protein